MEIGNLSDTDPAIPQPGTSLEKPVRVFVLVHSRDLQHTLLGILRNGCHARIVGVTSDLKRGEGSIPHLDADVVLLQLPVREGDGAALMSAILGLPNPPVVVVLSDQADNALRQRCLASGARAFLNTATGEVDRLADVLAAL